MSEVQTIQSPLGAIMWVFITGRGSKSLAKEADGTPVYRFKADIHLNGELDSTKEFIKSIDEFWADNKPKGCKKAKSLGYHVQLDEEDKPTGVIAFNFWTGKTFPDGKPKVVKTYNAKGGEVALGDKKIGNGTIGRIKGAMAIYDSGLGAQGVTLYLNSVQIKKFVEFEGDGFDAVEDSDDDDFAGLDDGMKAINPADEAASAEPRPEL